MGRPYRLPAFLTPRIFALEFIRQKLDVDDKYFSEKRYTRLFKLSASLGPFVVHSQLALNIVEEMMADMKFPTVGSAVYDPKGTILKYRDLTGKIQMKDNPYHVP